MYACIFFFFKQKTAYEMRISDWSSDVCSSDLQYRLVPAPAPDQRHDAPLHQLRRFVADRPCHHHGNGARPHPPPCRARRDDMSTARIGSGAPIVLATGGTGGPVFPAQALAAALTARGHRGVLAPAARGGREHGVWGKR